jgi:hypothetical protein
MLKSWQCCAAVIGFIATIRDGHPTTPIVVTSPIFSTPRETANPVGNHLFKMMLFSRPMDPSV